ncbi:hypothetical protein B0I35DRAFT_126079 [Stachybotrys elegans]|uniref:Uncharacterized protein n=1 Tax=Stachybotrys elegans TaxID=80388 RepID=A0A8K0T2X9_9HYPO|nr:hypothetical protein B0I35DRAFT_126079 [Stachybotrys elegans]
MARVGHMNATSPISWAPLLRSLFRPHLFARIARHVFRAGLTLGRFVGSPGRSSTERFLSGNIAEGHIYRIGASSGGYDGRIVVSDGTGECWPFQYVELHRSHSTFCTSKRQVDTPTSLGAFTHRSQSEQHVRSVTAPSPGPRWCLKGYSLFEMRWSVGEECFQPPSKGSLSMLSTLWTAVIATITSRWLVCLRHAVAREGEIRNLPLGSCRVPRDVDTTLNHTLAGDKDPPPTSGYVISRHNATLLTLRVNVACASEGGR